jgi:hypothetical protein
VQILLDARHSLGCRDDFAAASVVMNAYDGDYYMSNQLPSERQLVEVRFDNRDWMSATYKNGEFIDMFGLPLSREKISSWRPANANADASEHALQPAH